MTENSAKIGGKSITKNSENFNESTKNSTKMSPKLVKIVWIHQNLHKFCRKSRWAPIWSKEDNLEEYFTPEYVLEQHFGNRHVHHKDFLIKLLLTSSPVCLMGCCICVFSFSKTQLLVVSVCTNALGGFVHNFLSKH